MPDSASSGSVQVLPCCVEASPAYQPKARYALRMLLEPLGFELRWVQRRQLTAEGKGVYYGASPPTSSALVLSLPLHGSTVEYFTRKHRYPVDRMRWLNHRSEQVPVLFPLVKNGPAADGDLVASAFFWLSAWQEHVVVRRDRHGRFPFDASLQKRWGLAEQPVVDQYREVLAEKLTAAGVSIDRRRWHGKAWAFCPTHDIDYLRKWRPGIIYREVFEYFLCGRSGQPLPERWNRLCLNAKELMRQGDIYRRSFEQMQAEEERHKVGATFFIKTGKHGPHDVSDWWSAGYLNKRIKALQEGGFEIGLHPSYHAATHAGYMQEEQKRLEALTGNRPRAVRQHYLRFQAPLTARLQISAGFKLDASMGFAEREGFRHGTCQPFQMYDLVENQCLELWLFPLVVMDSTLFGYRKMGLAKALAQTRRLMKICQRYQGVCVVLWHNIIYDPIDGHGFNVHFQKTLKEAVTSGAYVGGLEHAWEGWRFS